MFIREEKYGSTFGPSARVAQVLQGQHSKFVVYERTMWERIKDWWMAPAW